MREFYLSVPYLIVIRDEVCEEDGDEHGEAVRDLASHLEDDDADGNIHIGRPDELRYLLPATDKQYHATSHATFAFELLYSDVIYECSLMESVCVTAPVKAAAPTVA